MALTSRRPARTLVAATALGGLLLTQQGCVAEAQDPAPATNPAAAGSSPSATTGSGDAGAASGDDGTTASPAPQDDGAILGGKRQTLIHIAEADKDWSASYEGPIVTGPGTDDGAKFRIVPSGEKYLIESLRPLEFPGPWCVVVKTGTGTGPSTLGTVECKPTADTLWAITGTGETDEKGRSTYTFTNEEHGALQYNQDKDTLYVQQLGDAPPTATYSFVDRGALEKE